MSLRLDDDRGLDEVAGGNAHRVGLGKGASVTFGVGLIEQDGEQRRSVHDHRGRPLSS
jgi:hypothetical protein